LRTDGLVVLPHLAAVGVIGQCRQITPVFPGGNTVATHLPGIKLGPREAAQVIGIANQAQHTHCSHFAFAAEVDQPHHRIVQRVAIAQTAHIGQLVYELFHCQPVYSS
jgi:hypothetical protein